MLYPLAKLRFLAVTRALSQIEDLLLSPQQLGDNGIVFARQEVFAEDNPFDSYLFRFKARFPGGEFIDGPVDDTEIRPRLSGVETKHDIAGFDVVAFAHEDFADDTAGRMLNFLYAGLNNEQTGGNHGPGDFRGRGPDADAPTKKGRDGEASEHMALERSVDC